MLTPNKSTLIKNVNQTNDKHHSLVNFDSPLQQLLQYQLPLLRLLNQQYKWQIWISAKPILNLIWLKKTGLHSEKIIELANVHQHNIIDVIEKALLAKTASYVVACIDEPLDEANKFRLQQAVKLSGTHLFLTDHNYLNYNDFMTMSLAINHIH